MNDEPLGLPTSIAQMRARTGFSTEEGRAFGLAYRPDPSDVFITPYAKCGTTLMQQIVHGLRTSGDMDFSEITEVVPWLEMAVDLGLDVHAPQKAWPRAFKSHLNWHDIPKGGRYIYLIRDPRDVLVSFYHFLSGWTFEAGSIDLETFGRSYFIEGSDSGRYWEHVLSWWPKRESPDTLFLAFEDVVGNLPATVERVAGFIGVGTEPERLEIATRQAHFDFMKAHQSHFDDHIVRDRRNAASGLPPGAGSTKVRSGVVGGHREVVSDELLEALAEVWRETVEPATGLRDYDAMRAALAD